MFVAGVGRDIICGCGGATERIRRCPALRRTVMHVKSPRSLIIALVWGAVCCACVATSDCAQLQNGVPAATAEPNATETDSPRPLDEWRTTVRSRLQGLEPRLAQPPAGAPAEQLQREQELLSHLELTLTQAIAEQDKAASLEAEKAERKQDRDDFVREGFSDGAPPTFIQLDETRDDLAAERRRLARLVDNSEAAIAALETARKELKDRASARRLAREELEVNEDDGQRQSLADKLALATLQNESAEAEVRLREQEVANARAARAAQELHVDLLEVQAARLAAVARFDAAELRSIDADLDRQKRSLEQRIAELESATGKAGMLRTMWMEAQQRLDAGATDAEALQQQVDTYRLELAAIEDPLPLLRKQLERVADSRTVWKRRQQTFANRPQRASIRQWQSEARKALTDLRIEEDNARLEVEELQNQLSARAALEANPQSPLVERQIASLRSLLEAQTGDLASISASQQLHEKLLAELERGTLAATFKDQLEDFWDSVDAVWNYELTSFGESPLRVRQVITALALVLAGAAMSGALSRTLGKQVLHRLNIDPSASATIQSLFYYLLLLCFGMFALKVVNVPLAAFTVLGGAVALGVGFGSQNIINNFISGLILHAERPVKVGDLIQLGDLYGNVEHIGARSTRVRTGANLDIIVPNSTFLQNNVINFTLSSDKVRTAVEVGVTYGSSVVTVTQVLRRAVLETGRVSKDPPPIILFKDFGPSALVFEVHFWIHMRTMMDQRQVESSVRYQIEQMFREAGIVIAFPQQDMHLNTIAPLEVRVLPPPQPATYP